MLISNTQTETLKLDRTLGDNWRGAYDLLVRPENAVTPLEKSKNLVRPLFQTESYGGITQQNLADIRAIPGVQVAAPVITVGTLVNSRVAYANVGDQIDTSKPQMLEVTPQSSSRGRPYQTYADPYFAYFSPQKLTDGFATPSGKTLIYSPQPGEQGSTAEQPLPMVIPAGHDPHPASDINQAPGSARVGTDILPLQATWVAIDPAAEAALYHLDKAVTKGHYLNDKPAEATGDDQFIPALVVDNQGPIDFSYRLQTQQANPKLAARWEAEGASPDLLRQIASAKPAATNEKQVAPSDMWEQTLSAFLNPVTQDNPAYQLKTDTILQPSRVAFARDGDALMARKQPSAKPALASAPQSPFAFSHVADDSGYRTLPEPLKLAAPDGGSVSLRPVGIFSAARLGAGSLGSQEAQAEVPLGLYQQPAITAADEATRRALRSDQLYPDLNPIGYQLPPVSVLTDMADTLALLKGTPMAAAPIASVRIRTNLSATISDDTLQQVRLIANQIHQKTGLHADITIGSAKTDQSVTLPASDQGIPQLNVRETWAKKGVVLGIQKAHDQKSVLIAGLILLIATLTTTMVALAQVHAQHTTLRTLAVIGWRPARIRAMLLKQWLIQGAVAGLAGTLLTYPLAWTLGLQLNPRLPLLALPIALALTLLVGLVASARATSATVSLGIGRTPPRAPRTHRQSATSRLHTSPARLGVGRFYLRPTRAIIGVINTALAVSALAVILWANNNFGGALVGNYLGRLIELQVRYSDQVAVAFMALLAALSLATLTWLNDLEDQPLYGILQSIGWTAARIRRTKLAAALTATLWGALVGAAASLGAAYLLLGHVTAPVWTFTALSVGVVLAANLVAALAVSRRLRGVAALTDE